MSFSLTSEFKPTGDQPKAIKSILDSFNSNQNHVTLQGVTGSGKTFTVANVIQEIKKPTLIVHGTEDPLIPIDHGLSLAENIPNASSMIMHGVGHELPEALVPALVSRIKSHFNQVVPSRSD